MYAKFAEHRRFCAAVVAVLMLAGWNAATFAQEKKPEPPKPMNIVDLAKEATDLKTFCLLIEKAELVDLLKEKGPYTVFAPTDEAFNKLGKDKLDDLQKPENKAKLQRIIKNHMLAEHKSAADLEELDFAKSMAGENLKLALKNGELTIEKAKVLKANAKAANGLMHTVDTVLMPKD